MKEECEYHGAGWPRKIYDKYIHGYGYTVGFCFEDIHQCWHMCEVITANITDPYQPYGHLKDCNVQCLDPAIWVRNGKSGVNYFEADFIFIIVTSILNLSIVHRLLMGLNNIII